MNWLVVKKLSDTEAVNLIEANLAKGPRRGPKLDDQDNDPDTGKAEAAA